MGAKSSRKSEKAHMEMYFLDEKIALDLLFVFAAKMPKILNFLRSSWLHTGVPTPTVNARWW